MTEIPESLRVALWATSLTPVLANVESWVKGVDRTMSRAAGQGASLLVMPELLCEQWLAFAPRGLRGDQEIPWMAQQAELALPALRRLPMRHGMALAAGSMPVRVELDGKVSYRNRAHLLLPDGRELAHDKLCLTPGERDPEGWEMATGNLVRVIEWMGLRVAVIICLDVELPALSARLSSCDLDLLLVPSMTERLSGYHRVFGCAKARAVELLCTVCVVGCIGPATTARPRPGNVSGAALYVPCEPLLGETGVLATTPPKAESDGPGPLLVADVPVASIRSLRRRGAEVWPGAWPAEHLVIQGC